MSARKKKLPMQLLHKLSQTIRHVTPKKCAVKETDKLPSNLAETVL